MVEGKLILSGWYSPDATEEAIRLYKESGLNHIFLLQKGYSCCDKERTREYLDLCDKYGIEAYLFRDRTKDIYEVVQKGKLYKRHSSFKGYCVWDEPHTVHFEKLKEELKVYKDVLGESDFFVNLFPSYCSPEYVEHDWGGYIRTYAREFLNELGGRKILSFDYYAICYDEKKGEYLADRWLGNTQLVADEADKYGADFSAFIQAMGFSGTEEKRGSRDREPTYKDINMQVYANLAFGAKMITYFCYQTPYIGGEFLKRHYAMTDREGQPTHIYESVKRINRELSDFAPRYLTYKRTGTYGISKEEYELFSFMKREELPESIKERVEFDFEGNLLLGCFERGRALAFMVVNIGETTRTKSCMLKMKFCKKCNVWVSVKGQTKSLTGAMTMGLLLDSGGGAFIELEPSEN